VHPPDDASRLEPARSGADPGDVPDPIRRAGRITGDAGTEGRPDSIGQMGEGEGHGAILTGSAGTS
jgi:hypothetical protein